MPKHETLRARDRTKQQHPQHCDVSAWGMADMSSSAKQLPVTIGTGGGCVDVVAAPDTTAMIIPPSAPPRNVKVDKLPMHFTDQQLNRLFERFGCIESAKVMLNVQTGESRGYGFVLFKSHEAAANAVRDVSGVDCVNDQTTGGGVFTPDVKFSEWNGECAAKESCAIYVRNIPLSATEEQLRTIFSTFGTIVSVTTRLQTLRQQPNKQQQQQPSQQQVSAMLSRTPPPTTTAFAMVMGHSVESNVSSIGGGGASSCTSSSDPSSASTTLAGTKTDSVAMIDSLNVIDSSSSLLLLQGNGSDYCISSPPPKEPLTKLATIHYDCVDSARAAILATHRQFLFASSGSVPVLTKFANVLDVKQRHQKQRQPVAVVHAPSSEPLQRQQVRVGHRPSEDLPTQRGPNRQGKSPLVVQPVAVTSAAPPPPPPAFSPLPMAAPPAPSAAFTMMRPNSARGHTFPGEVPLPVEPRAGFQKIFYQGALGVSPDGVLYPIRPEVCYYEPTLVVKPAVPTGGGSGGAPPQPTAECPPPCVYSFFPSPLTGGGALWIQQQQQQQQPHVPAAIVSAAQQPSLLFLPPPPPPPQPQPPLMAFSSSLSSPAFAAAAAQLEIEFPNACFDSEDEDEDANETIET